jgi:hypothetical protein
MEKKNRGVERKIKVNRGREVAEGVISRKNGG